MPTLVGIYGRTFSFGRLVRMKPKKKKTSAQVVRDSRPDGLADGEEVLFHVKVELERIGCQRFLDLRFAVEWLVGISRHVERLLTSCGRRPARPSRRYPWRISRGEDADVILLGQPLEELLDFFRGDFGIGTDDEKDAIAAYTVRRFLQPG